MIIQLEKRGDGAIMATTVVSTVCDWRFRVHPPISCLLCLSVCGLFCASSIGDDLILPQRAFLGLIVLIPLLR